MSKIRYLHLVTPDNPEPPKPPKQPSSLRQKLDKIVEWCWQASGPEFPGVEAVRQTIKEIQQETESIIGQLPDGFYGTYKGQVICEKDGVFALYYRDEGEIVAQWNYKFDSLEEVQELIDCLSN